MIINWMAAKAQQFLPPQDTERDELNLNFDFALSPEMMNLLYAQNDDGMEAGGMTPWMGNDGMNSVQQVEDADMIANMQFALDEYELALT